MRNIMKKITALLLTFSMVFSLSVTSFAGTDNNSITEKALKSALNESEVNATPIQLSEEEYSKKWNDLFTSENNVNDFINQIKNEGFIEDKSFENLAAHIVGNDNSSTDFYYYFKVYNNNKGEKIYAMFLSNSDADGMPIVYAVKANSNGQVSDYYNFKGRLTAPQWLCGLGSEFACKAFSAMLFELGLIAGLVGVGCDVIFMWACGYA